MLDRTATGEGYCLRSTPLRVDRCLHIYRYLTYMHLYDLTLDDQAYCKFSGTPVKILRGNNPYKSPSGGLPILHHNGCREGTVSSILTYLHRQNWGADINVNSKEQADIKAFTALIKEKLHPAFLHSWWLDEKAYDETTQPWFAKTCSFPRSLYFPKRMKATATITVYTPRFTSTIREKDIDQMIYKESKECLNLLSSKLGENDFFLGKRPCSLDALVFGYLAPLLKGPLQNNQLVIHLNNTPNLCALCNRILSRFFPVSPEDLEEKRKREQERLEAMQADALEFPNKRRNMILAGIFAVTAMIAFTLTHGLINIESRKSPDHSEEDVLDDMFEFEDHEGGEE
ncbi:hypothetical protein FSP39_010439 [Pinctada imbricata]|uniref:Metaxin n=1 Tax=Pinctada imbricata TaxID=66713 RepID=A0AA88Y3R3_PINIB|nr:hypothetical protein FSP39_010439 [Pinctada imbricata]